PPPFSLHPFSFHSPRPPPDLPSFPTRRSSDLSGGAFEITSIDCDFAAVAVTQSPTGPSDSFQINVQLRPEALSLGNINGKIRVTTTVPRYPELVIPLTGAII